MCASLLFISVCLLSFCFFVPPLLFCLVLIRFLSIAFELPKAADFHHYRIC